MRILSVSEYWPKLHLELPIGERPLFTTFRWSRKGKDLFVCETIQIVYKSRSKQRKVLGIAEIVGKEPRRIFDATLGDYPVLTNEEAVADGFDVDWDMIGWLDKTYGIRRLLNEPMNKLTLSWRGKAK